MVSALRVAAIVGKVVRAVVRVMLGAAAGTIVGGPMGGVAGAALGAGYALEVRTAIAPASSGAAPDLEIDLSLERWILDSAPAQTWQEWRSPLLTRYLDASRHRDLQLGGNLEDPFQTI